MRPTLRIRARGRQLHCLQQTLRRCRCPRDRLRAQMVLLSHQGYSPQQIASFTGQSDETVRRWLHRFRGGGCPGLREAPRSGRPPKITPAVKELLRQWAQRAPREFGVHRPTWTVKHLARQQPGYAQKRGRSPGSCGTRRGAPTSTCRTRRS